MIEHTFANLSHRLRALLADPMRGLQAALLMLVLLIAVGTIGYILLEGMTIVEAVYMTVITITTVGFGEVRPLSPIGRIFTSILILLGVSTVTTAVSTAFGIVLGPRLWLAIRERKMEEALRTINHHYLVCGYGRMGQQIVRDLRARNETFVVIEQDPEIIELLLSENILHVIGDATQDEVLHAAGIDRAVGLVSALEADANNVMTVLTAREINPKLFIVARAATSAVENRLRRAGADRVVSPYEIGGHRMALALLRPAVHDLLNRIFNVGDNMDMDVGQISIKASSPLAGQTIAQTRNRI